MESLSSYYVVGGDAELRSQAATRYARALRGLARFVFFAACPKTAKFETGVTGRGHLPKVPHRPRSTRFAVQRPLRERIYKSLFVFSYFFVYHRKRFSRSAGVSVRFYVLANSVRKLALTSSMNDSFSVVHYSLIRGRSP